MQNGGDLCQKERLELQSAYPYSKKNPWPRHLNIALVCFLSSFPFLPPSLPPSLPSFFSNDKKK